MLVETRSQLENLFSKVKPYFPEINPRLRINKKKRKNYVMVADVSYSGDILYNPDIYGGYSVEEVRGIFAHEFGHLINQAAMKYLSSKEKERRRIDYELNQDYRREIERAADRTAVLRGFGKEIYHLIFISLLDENWRKKRGVEHLSLVEIIRLMKK